MNAFFLHFCKAQSQTREVYNMVQNQYNFTRHTVVSLKPLSKGILLTAQGTLGTSSGGGNLPPETIEIHV